jgi:cobalt-zinc-cadmium efflux system membrane fusion protein
MSALESKVVWWLAASVIIGLCACGKARSAEHAPEQAAEAAPRASAPPHPGQEEHGEVETSDLDRPVDELFAATCEHGKKTFACGECRYEVGVVLAPKALFEGKLMRTEAVALHPLEEPVDLTGEVRFDERLVAHVSSQADGIIRRVMVSLGSSVKRNQPLVEIESLSVGEAEGAYLEAQAMLRLTRQSFERVEALRKEAIASEKEYYIARQELEAAEIRVASARGRLLRLGGGVPAAMRSNTSPTGGRLLLRAPSDGTVLSMHAVPGEAVRADESLLVVGENRTVWVWADVYERDVAKLAGRPSAPKLRALVRVRAYPSEDFPGTVDFMSPAMDESSRTAKLRVEVPNPEGRLLAGMFSKVQVFIPGAERVPAVSREAVLEDEGRSFVFVRHDDEYFVRRPVRVGRAWADRVEIVEGLHVGQDVATEGAFLMKSDVLRSKMGAGCAD